MDFRLTEEHRRLQERARDLAAEFASRSAEHDRDGTHPTEHYQRLRKEGFLELSIPKEWGGSGVGLLGHTLAFEALAQGCPSTALAFNMHASVVMPVLLRDNYWCRMLKRPNVQLVTGRIAHVTEHAIAMEDGARHPADVIILATGFQASKMLWPMEIIGRNGRAIRDLWGDDDPRAYLGMTVPGFPDLFVTYGPNTNLAHGGGIIFHLECRTRYILQALRKIVTVTSPWRLLDYWRLTRRLVPEEYRASRPGHGPVIPGQEAAAVSSIERLAVG